MHAAVSAANIVATLAAAPPPLHEQLGRVPYFDELLQHTRARIGQTTDWAVNDADPFGDGDQSYVGPCLPGNRGQSLIEAWAEGTELGLLLNDGVPQALKDQVAPKFVQLCVYGDAAGVEAALAAAGDGARELVSRRHTALRMSALAWAIAGARMVGKSKVLARVATDFVAVAKALLAAGADPKAKDVAGYTCLHHCTTGMFSATSLAVAELLLVAGVDVDAKNRAGRVALMEPTMNLKAIPCVRLLLEVSLVGD